MALLSTKEHYMLFYTNAQRRIPRGKEKLEKTLLRLMIYPPPCVLPETVNPNLPSGSNSIDPLVPDIHANPSTKKPPDPNQQPFQRITRSMTKLGTSISNITTKKLVDIQIENFSTI